MDDRAFDTLTRRVTLTALGAAGVASLSLPLAAAAKKKTGTDCKKKERQRCSQDTALCRALLTTCLIQPEFCDAMRACCDECSAHGLLTCVQAIQ